MQAEGWREPLGLFGAEHSQLGSRTLLGGGGGFTRPSCLEDRTDFFVPGSSPPVFLNT